MEENFRRVPPPPPRPFISRPPVGQEERPHVEDVNVNPSQVATNVQQVENVTVEKQEPINQVEEKKVKQNKEMNPKLRLSLLIAGSAVCFIGAVVCGVLLIV